MNDQLPVSEDAEKGLLCSMLLSPFILDEGDFSEALFHIPAHKIVFRHINHAYSDHGTTDFHLFKQSFRLIELTEIGGMEFLSSLYGFVPSSANWRFYRDHLAELHIRRTVMKAAEVLHAKMSDLQADFKGSIREVAEKGLTTIVLKAHDLNELYLGDEVERKEAEMRLKGKVPAMEATGIRALNLAMGGFIPGDQIVIGGETSFGKTALALNMATYLALGPQAKKVAIFSFEMTKEDIYSRIMASCAQIPLSMVRFRNLDDRYRKQLSDWVKTVPKGCRTITVQEGYSLDITEIVNRCRRLKATGDLHVVVVDYLQLVNPSSFRESNRQREVADISRRLKVMAGELGVVVIALSQLNDAGQLRESRAIGQDADVVLTIKEGKSDDALEKIISIDKNRHGPHGQKVPVAFYGDYVTFSDKS